ncbi:MAG: hypothetical protein GX271_10725 [Clostridiales bacterium]|jgi:hypothetical protein|nr:hypothetical protein [Clostridiales bacterium]
MKKSKRPMSAIFTVISIVAVILVLVYINQSKQSEKLKEASLKKLSEVEKLLEMDLDNDYPAMPRDLAKLHGDMTRLLYSGLEDEEIKELAIMIRELYDEEFLAINSEEKYLADLYTDIAYWHQLDRRIEYNLVVNKDSEKQYTIDGVEYANAFVSFTITEKGQTSELWRYTMRKDKDNKWKILGWEYVPDNKN